MEEILRRHGLERRALFCARVAKCWAANDSRFPEMALSEAFWGGRGAIWDVIPLRGPGIPWDRCISDESQYLTAMVGFADALDRAGLATQRSQSIATKFRTLIAQS
jgi:hypothetical protein